MRIRLQDEVLEAVRRLLSSQAAHDKPERRDATICRNVLWTAARILPSVYETILTSLVRLFREEDVARFLKGVGKEARSYETDAVSVEPFLRKLTADAQARLPQEVGRLVTMSVIDIDVDTYFMRHPRQEQFRIRAEGYIRRNALVRRVSENRERLRSLLSSETGIGNSLDELHDELRRVAHQATEKVLGGIRDLGEGHLPISLKEAREIVSEECQGYLDCVDSEFKRIHDRVARLQAQHGATRGA